MTSGRRRLAEMVRALRGLVAGLVALACAELPSGSGARVGPAGGEPEGQSPHPSTLEIRFLNVGQGDAVLLRSGGRTALVDTGPSDGIVQRLRALGVDTLDLLMTSHNHADHIGGADAILDQLPVRFYLENGVPATTRSYQRVLELVERKAVPYLTARARTFRLGEARLQIIPAPPGAAPDDQNNNSLSVVLEMGSFRALLTGDSEVEEINRLLASATIPDVDVLKAAHHGSRDGVTPAWLVSTHPEVVVISLGAGNPYGHPHEFALRYYCTGARRVYRTDRHGEVTVRVMPGGEYDVLAARDGAVNGCAP